MLAGYEATSVASSSSLLFFISNKSLNTDECAYSIFPSAFEGLKGGGLDLGGGVWGVSIEAKSLGIVECRGAVYMVTERSGVRSWNGGLLFLGDTIGK
jgi:hypothetical protein